MRPRYDKLRRHEHDEIKKENDHTMDEVQQHVNCGDTTTSDVDEKA